MKDLNDNERKIIEDNWNDILKNSNQNTPFIIQLNAIKVSCISRGDDIQIIIKKINESNKSDKTNESDKIKESDETNKSIKIKKSDEPNESQRSKNFEISKKARFIKFIVNEKSKKELIYEPKSIDYFIKYYKMQHPIYKSVKNGNENSGETLNISVGPSNYRTIFNDSTITEIYDDKFDGYIKKEEYSNYFDTLEIKVSDYYDSFSLNLYSKKINNDEILYSDERKEFSAFLNDIEFSKENFIFIIGCQKIGLSFTILQQVKNMKILYLNLEELFNLKKNSDKKKYIFRRLFIWFEDYETYESFINQKIFNITGYNNILDVIKLIVSSLCDISNENDSIKYIVIDNYDDFYVGSLKLITNYIEDLYRIINKKNIKIIILGRGIFISKLFLNYLFDKKEIQSYIKVKYITSLNLNLEKNIHDDYIKNGTNEIENYYKKKFTNNLEYILYNFVILKNLPNIINKSYQHEIPFQFFKFKMENNELKINYQFDDIIEDNKKIIRKYVAQINSLKSFSDLQNEKIKGYVFEDLIVSLFINNKTFENLKFVENNIIEVNTIFNMKNIKKNQNLTPGPILITQLDNGEVFDFSFIIEKSGVEYFIGGQIGLNKTKEDLSKYVSKIQENEKHILDNIYKLTGKTITELRFLIILSKEWQEELYKSYYGYYSNINNPISNMPNLIGNNKNKKNKSKVKKKKTAFEKSIEQSNIDKLNHFNSRYGVQCCKNEDISYIFFSNTDFKFYDHENKEIKSFDVEQLHPIKKGFEKFIFSEYNLMPISSTKIILTSKEINLLLNKIRETKNDIKDIEIKFKLKEKVPLLSGTPPNKGILSITKDIKVFTYYEDVFFHYLLKNNKISLYPQSGKLFDDSYSKQKILEQYFVNLISNNNNIIKLDEDEDEEKINNKKENKKSSSGKKRKVETNDKENIFSNNLKYLQNIQINLK